MTRILVQGKKLYFHFRDFWFIDYVPETILRLNLGRTKRESGFLIWDEESMLIDIKTLKNLGCVSRSNYAEKNQIVMELFYLENISMEMEKEKNA